MQLVSQSISIEELKKISEKMYGVSIKAAIDIEKKIMVVGADLHSDAQRLLLENDSEQENIWGINICPGQETTDELIEFESLINVRPSWGNRTRGVDDPVARDRIRNIVNVLVVQ